jgi:hypothetical protein
MGRSAARVWARTCSHASIKLVACPTRCRRGSALGYRSVSKSESGPPEGLTASRLGTRQPRGECSGAAQTRGINTRHVCARRSCVVPNLPLRAGSRVARGRDDIRSGAKAWSCPRLWPPADRVRQVLSHWQTVGRCSAGCIVRTDTLSRRLRRRKCSASVFLLRRGRGYRNKRVRPGLQYQ